MWALTVGVGFTLSQIPGIFQGPKTQRKGQIPTPNFFWEFRFPNNSKVGIFPFLGLKPWKVNSLIFKPLLANPNIIGGQFPCHWWRGI